MHQEGLIVKSTNGVAMAGLLMPAWLPSLTDVSEAAGLMVPILSAGWLAVQIIGYVRRQRDENRK